MQSSHGTFTEVLRIPLSRREEEEVEAGFGVAVGACGGAIILFSVEIRTIFVTEVTKALLGVNDASVELSVKFKAS
jgi:hypothetical protein